MEAYRLTAEEALAAAGSTQQGLSAAEAERRLQKNGRNVLSEGKKRSKLLLFLAQFCDLMTGVLILAAALSAGLAVATGDRAELVDTAILLFVVLMNAAVGFFQQYRADTAIEKLRKLSAAEAKVVRGGRIVRIDAEELVVGDIVELAEGDRVPADCRVLSSEALACDESMLTGESKPVGKADCAVAKAAVSAHANMVHAGTFCVRGSARALVTACGMETEMGRIAALLKDGRSAPAPLDATIAKLGRIVTAAVLFVALALFAGLMFGAVPAVTDEIKGEKKTAPRILLLIVGFCVPVAISLISSLVLAGERSLENLNAWQYILFVVLGFIVAITQIVPGLSATALLMAFGYFTPIMQSVHLSYWQEDPAVFAVYACLAVGFLLGLVTFSRLLTTIFAKWRKGAFFLIVGLSLGSIVTMFFNPDVCAVYEAWGTQLNVLDLVLGLVLFVVGVVIAYLFVKYERKKSNMSDIIHRK